MKDRTALGDHAAAIGGTRPSMAERAAAVLAWAGQPRQATPMRAARPLPCTVSRTPGRVICTTSTGAVRPVPASLNTTVCAAVAQAPAVWEPQGEEDLGGGMRAIFNLEASVDLADGASKSSFWNRYAYVGLSSERLGTLTLGRQKDLPSQFAKGEPVKSLGK